MFDYLAKSGVRRVQAVQDPPTLRGGDGAQAPARGRRPAAGLPRGPALAPACAPSRSTTTSRRRSARSTAPRTSGPGTRPCWRRCRWPPTAARRRSARARKRAIDGAVRGRGRGARQHARRWPGAPTSIRGCSTATCRAGRSGAQSTASAARRARRPPARALENGGARPARRRPRVAGGGALRRPQGRLSSRPSDGPASPAPVAGCDRTGGVCDLGRSAMAVTSGTEPFGRAGRARPSCSSGGRARATAVPGTC